MKKSLFILSIVFASLGFFIVPLHAQAATYPELESIASSGTQSNEESAWPSLSSDGRYIVFSSTATNLIAGAGSTTVAGKSDIFIHDRQTGTTQLISRAPDGTPGDKSSSFAQVSPDGRYIVYHSDADNLVPNDTNGATDIFIYDMQTGATNRVSVASDGTQGNQPSLNPVISADDRYVAFSSEADNLIAGDTNGTLDIFVHDLQTGITERVNVASDGTQANPNETDTAIAISSDGRYVSFSSRADNLVPNDTNDAYDVFVHDRQNHTTERVSVASEGTQGDRDSNFPAISSDGRYVAFESDDDNLTSNDTNGLTNFFVHDRQTGITENITTIAPGTHDNRQSVSITPDGRYVAFHSLANNLVAGDTNRASDAFIYDRQTKTMQRISVASDGTQGDSDSVDPVLSQDGHYIGFESFADNLVLNDTNVAGDVFLTVNPFDPPVTNTPPTLGTVTVTPSPAHINSTATASATFTDPDTSDTHTAIIDWGDGTGSQSAIVTESSGSGTVRGTHAYTGFGTYTVTVSVTDTNGETGQNSTSLTVVKQLTALNPATMYISKGLLNLLNKFDLKAEVYKDSTLVTSGEVDNVNPGTSATAETVPFNAFSPVDFPSGSALKIAVYACSASGLTTGTATLHYNASSVDSKFGATIGTTDTIYHLLTGSVLGTTAGTSAQTATAKSKCSSYTSLGTWTVTP